MVRDAKARTSGVSAMDIDSESDAPRSKAEKNDKHSERKSVSPPVEDDVSEGNGPPAASDDDKGEGSEDLDEEEYEIEAILKHKMGYLIKGNTAYFVKWKGYDDPAENSWIDESDANAPELINEYWEKVKRERPNSRIPGKTRKSLSSNLNSRSNKKQDTTSVSSSPPAATKRGRPPVGTSETSDADDDTQEGRKKSKIEPKSSTRTSTTKENKAKTNGKGTTMDADEDAEDEAGKVLQPMHTYHQFMKMKSWENMIKEVETIEATESGDLLAYFTTTDGTRSCENTKLMAQKCPLVLINFYETHLKWKPTEGTAE